MYVAHLKQVEIVGAKFLLQRLPKVEVLVGLVIWVVFESVVGDRHGDCHCVCSHGRKPQQSVGKVVSFSDQIIFSFTIHVVKSF